MIRADSEASSPDLSKSKIKSTSASPVSLWSKCKEAVHEFRSFQTFLRKRYSSPGDAFDFLVEGCKESPTGCVSREDFTRLVGGEAGFKGDTGLVFAMLKGGDDCITRDNFKKRLKARPNKEGDAFAAVVGQAVAFAALEKGVTKSSLELFSRNRGRSQPRQKKAEKSGLTRGSSKGSLTRGQSKDALTRGRSKDSLNTESSERSRPSSKGPKRRSSSKKRASSKSPEPSKRDKSLHRQKSK
jgi:hypothetical protein